MNLKKNTEKLVLIDVHALVHRAYHAYPAHLSANGVQTNAAYGFTALLLEVLEKFKPEYVMCAVDIGKPTRRLKIFKEYKATRKPTDQELLDQLPIVHEIIESFGIPIYKAEGYEADDLIGTIVNLKNIENRKDLETVIVTGDKDIFQLVDHNTYVYMAGSAFSGSKLYGIEEVKEKMGFGPEYVIDYKALCGDPSDNIPGIAGIGDKGAKELIAGFGHLKNIIKNKGKVEKSRVKNALAKGIDDAKLSAKLATIETDIDVDFDLENSRAKTLDPKVLEVFEKYRFNSLVKRLDKLNDGKVATKVGPDGQMSGQQQLFGTSQRLEKAPDSNVKYEVLTEKSVDKFLKKLEKAKIFAFDTETDSLNYMNCDVVGMSFSFETGEAYYLSKDVFSSKKAFGALKRIFQDPKIKKIGHNIKFDIHALKNIGIDLQNAHFDTMIAAYILQMGEGRIGLKSLAALHFGMQMKDFKELLKLAGAKGQVTSIPQDDLGNYACADADATWRLYELFDKSLEEKKDARKLFESIEMPLVSILIEMERNGIGLDSHYLKKFANTLDKRIDKLQKQIIDLAGVQFNINSTQQLSEVLFGKLKLQGSKKTSSGAFSTNERVLREIRDQHKIIDLVLEYREIAKLRSTYTDALIDQIDPGSGRVHSSFSQSVASTGRLSSSDPNLQNIPVASELGNKIREAFVPEKGRIFVSLDYSQQELRVLAGVSHDKELVRGYEKDVDVHKLTATKLFGVSLDKVIKQQRSMAKTVNFSIMYGISAFGLSDRLKIPREKAQGFIDGYFELYPGVREYFDDLLDKAKTQGYVETLVGRRRGAVGLRSPNFRVRGAVEREIVNFPIQGGAADMMKKAMIEISHELEGKKWEDYKLILQIHDEFVFEVPVKGLGKGSVSANDLERRVKGDSGLLEFISMVRGKMLAVNDYDIDMKVDVGVGLNWGDIREIGG